MFFLTDSTLNKVSGGTGFYILAWLPLVVIAVFAIKGMLQKKKDSE